MSGLDAVQAIRTALWANGFRCLPVQNAKRGDKTSGKAPLGTKWPDTARQDPPECLKWSPVPHALNTGILCDGLRAIDLDIDDPGMAGAARVLATTMLGSTLVRTRTNSPRCLLIYRAAEGQPSKIAITGATHSDAHACKIEVLGKGQQFVAYGGHWSGSELQWVSGGPADQNVAICPAITEADVSRFLNAATPLIGAKPIEVKPPPKAKANGQDAGLFDQAPTAELRDITAALALIPNGEAPDWESWNNVGLAIYAATEGSEAGWALWRDWSAKNPADNADATLSRWEHYATSPPDRTGAGKLFAMAVQASPGWRKPSTLGKGNGAQPAAKPLPEPEVEPPVPEVEVEAEEPPPPDEPPGGPRRNERPEIPVIICRPGELPRMIREAQAALIASGAAIYQRGMLVQPVEQEYKAADGSTTHSAALVPITGPALLKLLSEAAEWQKWDGRAEAMVVCDPPPKLVDIILHNRGDWPFPVVRGVLTCPTLRPDGSLLTTSGYDPISRYFLMFPQGLEIPDIPGAPTIGHAGDSLQRLDMLLDGYPFVNDASRSVALAMLMTQVVRCAMPVSPLLAVSAKAPGTGKSHLVDLCSTVAIGRACPVMGATSDDKETEKGIHTMLLSGVPGFSVDNVSRDLDTPTLNMATERPLITVRLFGVLESVEVENSVTIYMTGNNLAIIDEQGRRTIRCELDAGRANPERRTFKSDPILIAREDRGQLIADVLTIARAYHVSGEKVAPFPIGSYGAWSHFVREPLIWLGRTDPAETMNETASEDPATIRLHAVVEGWAAQFKQTPQTLATAVRTADENLYATLKEQFPARGGDTVDTLRMGYWMRKFAGRVANGKRFVQDQYKEHGTVRWKIELLP